MCVEQQNSRLVASFNKEKGVDERSTSWEDESARTSPSSSLSSSEENCEGPQTASLLLRHRSADARFWSGGRRGDGEPAPVKASLRRGEEPGADAAAGGCASAQEHRIAVDPDTDAAFISFPASSCDACRSCDDTCEVLGCRGCDAKRAALASRYGKPTSSATPAMALLGLRYPNRAEFSVCEVRRHCLAGSAWIVSGSTVYDVTSYLEDHPGGKRSILRKSGGQDCSEDLGFHSKAAQREWRQFRIGKLVPCGGGCKCGGDSSSVAPAKPAACKAECVVS